GPRDPPVLRERGDRRTGPRGVRPHHVRGNPPQGRGEARAARAEIPPGAHPRGPDRRLDPDRAGRPVAGAGDRPHDARREAVSGGTRTRPPANLAVRCRIERKRSPAVTLGRWKPRVGVPRGAVSWTIDRPRTTSFPGGRASPGDTCRSRSRVRTS